jgi:Zn-dependent peptidase ImmA (M78 family)
MGRTAPPLEAAWRRAADARALRERKAVGLTATCRLEPVELARSRGIVVVGLSALKGVASHHVKTLHDDPKGLSAVTVLRDDRALICVNDAHTPERQRNSTAHELAHLMLAHPPSTSFFEDGQRVYPQRMEDEANWFAAAMLVPASGLRGALREHRSQAAAAAHYGVSIELMRWRCNMHGLARLAS